MEIKNIVFDIGGVLAKSKFQNWFMTPHFWDILDRNMIVEDEVVDALNKYTFMLSQEPKTELEEFWMFSKYYYQVLMEIDYPYFKEDLPDRLAYDIVFDDEKFVFYDDVEVYLEKFSKRFNLYILSNGWPSSYRVLKNKNLDKYFKRIVISSLYGTTKEERLFEIFLNLCDELKAEETLFIDDRKKILESSIKYNFVPLQMTRTNEDTGGVSSMKELESWIESSRH